MTFPRNGGAHERQEQAHGDQSQPLISYYIVLSFWDTQTVAISIIYSNTGGQTKKTIVGLMNFVP
ncbi:hypothetical protein A1O1_07024 [Capronia coronata CBS 617.96]|uniref:Uncharacterized protein n=1 Tax=Capronia coronata CBS 617.96 TaxID=1182541 RepID=W9XS90_9EURO|nr:uncharacterized protein A1O1_07024 [Capronia coronata CBS 617.96]EXJ83402.1 hypothetical protein A1O1_07024 [Capronia coronata CBS 617.96]